MVLYEFSLRYNARH